MNMIFGPQFNPNINRIQPVDSDPNEQDQREKRKRRVLHQGRAWAEAEEDDLPLKPTIPQNPPPTPPRKTSTGVYADRQLLERAQNFFNKLVTLEEKAAQLCFLVTEAIYDALLQREVELTLQTWQLGGILFHKGEYRRQAYLIERYQSISKTPLLIANDYQHGMSFYLQGGEPPKNNLSEKHYSDLGKAVMVQNRRLGVHVQFDRERGKEKLAMSEIQAKAFRKGIRGAHGIVGKEKVEQITHSHSAKGNFPLLFLKNGGGLVPNMDVQNRETISFKTLTFFDASSIDKNDLEDELLRAFKELYDVFLFSSHIPDAIRTLVHLVRSGKITEETLDRHVMKALIIKALFFKKTT